MDGASGEEPLLRRQSNKTNHRDFSTMSAHHGPSPPNSVGINTHDEHYNNEHSSRRRRLHSTTPARQHYPGDGFDFRRPVVSASIEPPQDQDRNPSNVIDLTSDDVASNTQNDDVTVPAGSGAASAGSSQYQTPANTNQPIIDLSGEESEPDTSNLPGSNYLDWPPEAAQRRSHELREENFLQVPNPGRTNSESAAAGSNSHSSVSSRQPTPGGAGIPRTQRNATPHPFAIAEIIDLTEETPDDVIITEARQRAAAGVNLQLPGGPAAPDSGERNILNYRNIGNVVDLITMQGGRLMQRLQNLTGFDPDAIAQLGPTDLTRHHHHQQHHHHHHHHHHHVNRNNGGDQRGSGRNTRRGTRQRPLSIHQYTPPHFDYTTTAFQMGYQHQQGSPTPKYSPPPAPEDGFTRTPGEDEVVICPNCGDELATGDSEQKQEVWIIKQCGHAYCGDCAHNRAKSAAKRGKGKGKEKERTDCSKLPLSFKKCVVRGCEKPAAKSSLVHVFLGS